MSNKMFLAMGATFVGTISIMWALSTTPNRDEGAHPPGLTGAKAVLQEFAESDADVVRLCKKLEPRIEDYDALFTADAHDCARQWYTSQWSYGSWCIGSLGESGHCDVFKATSEELQTRWGQSYRFKEPYLELGHFLKPGLTIYGWRCDGGRLGRAQVIIRNAGLVHVNGRWLWIFNPSAMLEECRVSQAE
jgi:hypothetical protein